MLAGIGSVLLALCGLPEAIRCYRNKRCDIGYLMLISWLLGELFLIVYTINTKQYILLINYIANVAFVLTMLYYKRKS